MAFLLGIFSGLVASLEHRAIRVARDIDPLLINVLRFCVTLTLLSIIGLVFNVIRVPSTHEWSPILTSLGLEVIIMYTYVRAIQLSEQSLVGPLFGLSLVFLVPLSALFLGEYPSYIGLVGMGLIVGGILVLRAHGKYSLGQTFLKLRTDTGAHYMLVAAFAAALSMVVMKGSFISGLHPINFGFWVNLALLVIFSGVSIIKGVRLRSINGATLIAATLFGAGQISMYIGVNLMQTAYFIALKRSSIFFDIVIGKVLGGETHFEWKVLGALVILGGVGIILFS